MGLDLLAENVHLLIQIIITHPLIILQIHYRYCFRIALLRILALNVDHDDIGAVKLAVFCLGLRRPCGLALILVDGGDELHLRIAIAFTVVG